MLEVNNWTFETKQNKKKATPRVQIYTDWNINTANKTKHLARAFQNQKRNYWLTLQLKYYHSILINAKTEKTHIINACKELKPDNEAQQSAKPKF